MRTLTVLFEPAFLQKRKCIGPSCLPEVFVIILNRTSWLCVFHTPKKSRFKLLTGTRELWLLILVSDFCSLTQSESDKGSIPCRLFFWRAEFLFLFILSPQVQLLEGIAFTEGSWFQLPSLHRPKSSKSSVQKKQVFSQMAIISSGLTFMF